MQYSKSVLIKEVTAARDATLKAMKEANEAGAKAVLTLAEEFVGKGGQTVSTREPVVLSAGTFSVDSYNTALKHLELVAGDAVETSELVDDCLALIQNSGKINRYKRTVTIS